MKYPPPYHQDHSKEHLIEVIKAYPLATVISISENEPLITHMPLIFCENGKLIGHIDKFNPQAELLKDNKEVTLIFSGPQCYISPSVYTTTQLPTWNYIKVHLKGKATAVNDRDAVKTSLIKMTEFLEQPDHKFVLTPDNPRMERAVDYVKGFEIEITDWEGKFKLSQDKKKTDMANARAELIRTNQQSVADFLDRVFR